MLDRSIVTTAAILAEFATKAAVRPGFERGKQRRSLLSAERGAVGGVEVLRLVLKGA